MTQDYTRYHGIREVVKGYGVRTQEKASSIQQQKAPMVYNVLN